LDVNYGARMACRADRDVLHAGIQAYCREEALSDSGTSWGEGASLHVVPPGLWSLDLYATYITENVPPSLATCAALIGVNAAGASSVGLAVGDRMIRAVVALMAHDPERAPPHATGGGGSSRGGRGRERSITGGGAGGSVVAPHGGGGPLGGGGIASAVREDDEMSEGSRDDVSVMKGEHAAGATGPGGVDDAREAAMSGVAASILLALPALIDADAAARTHPPARGACMNAVLQHEIAAYNRLLTGECAHGRAALQLLHVARAPDRPSTTRAKCLTHCVQWFAPRSRGYLLQSRGPRTWTLRARPLRSRCAVAAFRRRGLTCATQLPRPWERGLRHCAATCPSLRAGRAALCLRRSLWAVSAGRALRRQ
jgi:hypothetical protein